METLIAFVLFFGSMVGLIIGLALLLCCSLFEEEMGKVALIGLGVLVLSGILFSLYIYPCRKITELPWEREAPYVTHTVMALSDGNEVNGKIRGSRYSMSGYINEKFTYIYGYKTVGGGMKIQKAGADTSVVYFRDDIDPCAKWYRETRKFWWVTDERYTCDIFIPTGSLEARISIDLE